MWCWADLRPFGGPRPPRCASQSFSSAAGITVVVDVCEPDVPLGPSHLEPASRWW